MTLVGAAVLVGGASSIAVADGYEPVGKGFVAPAPIAYSWSGVYMGVHGGYAWGDSDIKELEFQIVNAGSFSSSNNVDGGLGGVHLGMNKQYGNVVIGGEFRLSGANIDGSTRDCAGLTTQFGGPGSTFNCKTNVNWVAAALARLGYASNFWHVYGTLGWAVAGVDYRPSITPPVPTDPVDRTLASNDTADGFAFGGGFEYAFTDDVSFGVEYTRMNLKSDGSGLFFGGGPVSRGDRDVDLNTVTGRLNFKWGG